MAKSIMVWMDLNMGDREFAREIFTDERNSSSAPRPRFGYHSR